MTKVNHSSWSLRSSIHESPFLEVSPSNSSSETEAVQQKVAEEIAKIHGNELAGDLLQNFDDVDLHGQIFGEPDDSQPLTIEPPLTLSKICSKLTAVERLWLARVVKAHGKELVLARWPVYEVHINYVRYLR